jgi:RimJ/RimL family protein N-acetyltransferase
MHVPELCDGVVRLREWGDADAEWYAATAAGDELIQRFTSESATVTAEQVRAAIADLGGAPDCAGFLICDAVTGERLGNMALRHTDGIGDVSYWLAAPARGRGFASRSLRLCSDWAFERLGLHELRLWTHAGNTASRRVAERAGYLRHPELDQPRPVKGAIWETVAYRLPAPTPG